MTREDINNIISAICTNDEDFEKPIISPAYLKKELEALALEQEPCEDCIDRADAMTEIMMFAGNKKHDDDIYIKVSDAVELMRELPSVTPQEPKTDVLDKIRAEIAEEKIGHDLDVGNEILYNKAIDDCLQIIDKYRQEG